MRDSTCYNEATSHQIEEDEMANVIEKRSESGDEERNQTGPEDVLFEEIGKIERDIIISVLVSACIVPILCGVVMVICQLSTQIKKKHLRKRMRVKKQQIERSMYNDSLNVIRMMGPLQLHESFPQYINGVPREELECYMNRSAVEREVRVCGNTNVLRNNPETGQIEGDACSVPLTPSLKTPIPKIAIQFPSPVVGAPADTLYNPRFEESNNFLYPPLPSNFKQGSPLFPMQPKNSTPRSPDRQQLSPGQRRPSIRETPDRLTCHQRSVMLLKQITMSPPPSYYLMSKNRELTGKSLPCLLHEQRTSTCTNINQSMSGAGTMKDRSSSESDISV